MKLDDYELEPVFIGKLGKNQIVRKELIDSIRDANRKDNSSSGKKLSEFDPVWIEELSYKNSMLDNEFEPATQEELYVDLLGSIDTKCDLLLNRAFKRSGVKFNELQSYIDENHNVFIYTQSFDTYFRDTYYPKCYEALQNWYAIVVDVDDVRSEHLESILYKIKAAPIKPNYILSTGGGLHLYYMLRQPHNVKGCIGLMAYGNIKTDDEVEPLLTHRIGYHKSYLKFLDPYETIKQGMIAWFSDTPVISDTQNHLTQPSRLLGSKTKNPDYYVKGYKAFDVKYSMQELALQFDIELPDESDIDNWIGVSKKIKSDADRTKSAEKALEKKSKKAIAACTTNIIADVQVEFKSPEMIQISDDENINEFFGSTIDAENVSPYIEGNRKYKFDWTQMTQKMTQIILDQQIRDREYLQKKKLEKAQGNKRATPQALGRLSQYRQFKNWILKIGDVGNRTGCLISFWLRSHMYIKNEQMIERDYDDIAWQFQSMSTTNVLTDADVARIKRKKPRNIRDLAIIKLTGYKPVFKRNQDVERADAKIKTATKQAAMLETITAIAKDEFERRGKCTYGELSKVLLEHGVKRSPKTLSTTPAVREIKGDPPLIPVTKKKKN